MVNNLGEHKVTYEGDTSRPLQSVTTLPGQATAFLTQAYQWQANADGARLARLSNLQGATAQNQLSVFDYTYSPDGEITNWRRTFGSGAASTDISDWQIGYDPLRQMTSVIEKDGTGAALKTWGWAYDTSGNRTHEVEGSAMRLATIGKSNRLERIGGAGAALIEGTVDERSEVSVNGLPARLREVPGGGGGFVFSKEIPLKQGNQVVSIVARDANGNATTKKYTISVGGVARTLEHDLNGNLVRESIGTTRVRKYEWDSLNRLIAIQSHETPVDGATRTEFAYDGMSRRTRRVEKSWNGTDWIAGAPIHFLWCGTEICQKRGTNAALPVTQYHPQGEERIVSGVSTPYYYTRDHLGSIREVITNDGSLVARYDYNAWGERTRLGGGVPSSVYDCEFGFTGHQFHARSGLHLAMFRAYDANLGRWLSEDPLGEEGGLNLYGYVGNGPVTAVDILGLFLSGCTKKKESAPEGRDLNPDRFTRQELANVIKQTELSIEGLEFAANELTSPAQQKEFLERNFGQRENLGNALEKGISDPLLKGEDYIYRKGELHTGFGPAAMAEGIVEAQRKKWQMKPGDVAAVNARRLKDFLDYLREQEAKCP